MHVHLILAPSCFHVFFNLNYLQVQVAICVISTITIQRLIMTVPTLYGNQGELEKVRLLTPCTLDTPLEEMQRKYWEDGVLWVCYKLPSGRCMLTGLGKIKVKRLADPEIINKFRGDFLAMIGEGNNMLKPGSSASDGIFNPDADWREYLLGGIRVAAGIPNEGPFVEKAYKAHQWRTYVDLKEALGQVIEPFAGRLAGFKEPWCLPRSLLRFAVPGGDTTPVHYDQIFLRAGPPTSVTAWVPLGDVELEGGGLIYLDQGHDIGVQHEADFAQQNAGLSDEERMSAFNQNMNKGGWLDQNASRFGRDYKRAWLAVW